MYLQTALSALLTFALVAAQCDVKVGYFTAVGTLSIANQQGFFQTAGLNNVCFTAVPNSLAAYQYLANGTIDVLQGSIDNTINRVYNGLQNVTALAATDLGPDILIAGTNGVRTFADLRGKVIIVDALNSGYAYLIQRILLNNGLSITTDYTFAAVGSTPIRYNALLNGKTSANATVYATLLTYPYSGFLKFANRSDISILGVAADYVQPYGASSLNVQTSNLQNATKVELYTKYLTAYALTANFINNTANTAAGIAAIQRDLNISTSVATYLYTQNVLDRVNGDIALNNLTANRLSIINTATLRQQFNGFTSNAANFTLAGIPKTEGGTIFDYTILAAAKLRAAALIPAPPAPFVCPFNVTQKETTNYIGSGSAGVYSVTVSNSGNTTAVYFSVSQQDQLSVAWQFGLLFQGYQAANSTYLYKTALPVSKSGSYVFNYGGLRQIVLNIIGC